LGKGRVGEKELKGNNVEMIREMAGLVHRQAIL
jgi:hypothetical protein